MVANLRFLKANEGDLSTVQNLVIPQFNEDGHLSWELHASQVTSKDSDTFLTTNPILICLLIKSLNSLQKAVPVSFYWNRGRQMERVFLMWWAAGSERKEMIGNGLIL